MTNIKHRIVVIGGVAAGMSAASKLRRMNNDFEIIVFQDEAVVSYGACGLPYYVGDVFQDSQKLIVRRPDDFRKQGIDVRTQHLVTGINPDTKFISVKNLSVSQSAAQYNKEQISIEEFSYDQLVIASGAKPIVPGFMRPALELDNVFTLRTVADGIAIKKQLQRPGVENVLIVGGGYIGLELAEACVYLGKKVTVIDRNSRLMTPYDPEITELLLAELQQQAVNVCLNEEALEVTAQAVTTNSNTYAADVIILALGVAPNTSFIAGSGIATLTNGAIITDDKMQTNIKDIYAAGDCSAVWHNLLNKHVHIPLGTHANKQGRILGSVLAGTAESFPGVIGTSAIKVLDICLARTGLSENEAQQANYQYKTAIAKTHNYPGYYPGSTELTVKLIYEIDSLRLLGAQIAGDKSVALRIGILATAITAGMTTKQIAMLDLAYAPPFASVWDAVQVAANLAN